MKTLGDTKRLSFYLGLGMVWLLLWVVSFVNNPEIFAAKSINEVWRGFYLAIANFIFFEYCLPLITEKRRFIVYNLILGALFISMHCLVVSFGLHGWAMLGVELDIYTQFRQSTLIPGGLYNELLDDAFYQAEAGIASFLFFGVAKLLYHNFQLRQTAQELRLEKQESELIYLKSQTNPHFLFNTLNNIYALAKDKSDLAPESILRLSKILRFMLYETGGAFISVNQEQEIIADYIALEKLRYDDSLRIGFTHEIDEMSQPIPPLLLIPLVENAFKHGASEMSGEIYVDIQLSVVSQKLVFTVKNSAEDADGKPVKENIGLANLRRQLALLYTDYKLSVGHDKKEFTAMLRINLESHV
jgi:two-component system LytT family sensor kinase